MISSWSTCHKILHILMFITSFEEQNITYRSCSNLRIHLFTYDFENPVNTEIIAKGTPILEKIRANIAKGNYIDKLTTEGNSGLYKIASMILERDPKGSIDFQYLDDCFSLKLIQTLSWKN